MDGGDGEDEFDVRERMKSKLLVPIYAYWCGSYARNLSSQIINLGAKCLFDFMLPSRSIAG